MRRIRGTIVVIALLYAAAITALALIAGALPSPSLPESGGESRAAIVFYTDDADAMLRRVETGIRLYRERRIARLVMTGGWRPGRDNYHGAARMKAAAVARGIPGDHVLTDQGSNDSWSNLEQALAAIATAGVATNGIVFVSDPLHLIRLRLVAALQGVRPPVTFVPTTEPTAVMADIGRLNHELLAYLSLALPRDLVRSVLGRTRHA